MSLLDMACSVPWLMDEPSLRGVLAFLDRDFDAARLIEARRGERVPGARMTENRSGVAVLSITGPIVRHADLLTEFCGGATTAAIAREFTAAIDSPDFHSVLLNIHSPGGEAAGIEELAAMIRDRRGTKPIVAYVEAQAASAAYWIASAADEVVLGRTAFVGSIGAIMTYRDATEADKRRGVEDIDFVSDVSPLKRPDVKTDAGRAQVQAIVDAIGSAFVDSVASNRGVSRDVVLADFGRGGVVMGRAAVRAGMADQVSTFEKTLKSLVSRGGKPRKASGTKTKTTGDTMGLSLKQVAAILGLAATAAGPAADDDTPDPDSDAANLGTPDAKLLDALEALSARLAALEATPQAGEEAVVEGEDADPTASPIPDGFAAEAAAYAEAQAARLTPPGIAALEDLYLQARLDDRDGGARLDSLRAFVGALPEHGLFSDTALDAEDRLVPAPGDEDDADDPLSRAAARRFGIK